MNSKKSKVNKIKLCLKKGIPVAVIAAGVVAAANGCEDNSKNQPSDQYKSTGVSAKNDPRDIICGKLPEELKVIATLKLDDSDFNKDLTKLSEAGNKKLNDFTRQLAEKKSMYELEGRDKIISFGFSEKDAERERKKANAVFDKYSSYLGRTAGLVLTKDFIIKSEIARTLANRFHFKRF
ncbi:MAG: hypothetical protein J6S90_08990 [Lentisphaeria bacterium]|nr:hypothetical protein [Lentisphaeria bacterium]